jgi:hypothetical protein
MKYTYKHEFSYADMETKCRIYTGDTELDLSKAVDLLNSKNKRIAELEKMVDFILNKVGFDSNGFYLPCGNGKANKVEAIKNINKALKEQGE